MNNKKLFTSVLAGIMAGIMLLTLLLSAVASTAHAASSSEIKVQIEDLQNKYDAQQEQIDALQKEQSDNLTEIQDIVAQKNNIDQQIALMYGQVSVINAQIAAYSVLIADMQEDLDEAEARLADLTEKNRLRIRAMEENGELSYWSVLFRANSFSDLLDRLNMVQEIAAADRRRLQELSDAASEVSQVKAAMLEEKAALQANKDVLSKTQDALAVKNQETQNLLAQLAAKGDEYEKLMEKFEQDQYDLLQSIAQANKEYDEAKRQEWLAQLATATRPTPPPTTAPVTEPPTEPTTGGNSGSGGSGGVQIPPIDGSVTWMVPCDYRVVTSPFGMRIHPITGQWAMHTGVDLAGGNIYGKPVYATRSGVVQTATWDDAGGNFVVLDHLDGYISAYLHMIEYIVAPGDIVVQGQIIGYVGSTGGSTGPHLHFGIAYCGEYVNPMDYIS